jgi:hypothetical protein
MTAFGQAYGSSSEGLDRMSSLVPPTPHQLLVCKHAETPCAMPSATSLTMSGCF